VIDQRVEQQGFAARFGMRQPGSPLPNESFHVALGLTEFSDLAFEGTQLFFREVKHAPAGNPAFVAHPEDFRKFGESES